MKLKKFLLFGILSLFLFSCAPAAPQEIQIIQAEQRTISVTATGEIKAPPDVAEVIFGIYSTDNEVALARDKNNEILQNVLAALKNHEIPQKDIKVDYQGMFAETSNDSPLIYRYGVRSAIQVTVHDLTELESIITNVLEVGDVRISAVYFKISELERFKQQARDLAIQSAKEKARNMVVQFGQEIDLPLSIQEYSASASGYPESSIFTSPLFEQRRDYYYGNVSFRQVTITSTVSVTYSLKLQ